MKPETPIADTIMSWATELHDMVEEYETMRDRQQTRLKLLRDNAASIIEELSGINEVK